MLTQLSSKTQIFITFIKSQILFDLLIKCEENFKAFLFDFNYFYIKIILLSVPSNKQSIKFSSHFHACSLETFLLISKRNRKSDAERKRSSSFIILT